MQGRAGPSCAVSDPARQGGPQGRGATALPTGELGAGGLPRGLLHSTYLKMLAWGLAAHRVHAMDPVLSAPQVRIVSTANPMYVPGMTRAGVNQVTAQETKSPLKIHTDHYFKEQISSFRSMVRSSSKELAQFATS